MVETVLLTGISGFIAKHIAAQLLNAGYAVRGSLRTPSREAEVRDALVPLVPPEALARLSFTQLDLEKDAGWPEAMAGIAALLHTASPFPLQEPKNPEDLIRPAVEGTLRALTAAQAAGVTRVILTSSTVAVLDARQTGLQDESNWCDLTSSAASSYARSKTLAEHAAWDFATEQSLSLTTINPGLVLGPPLDAHTGSSINLITRVLKGKDPMLPDLSFPVVDVRDVALMHLRALQRPETAGKRFIAATGNVTMPEIGRILKAAYPARRIATRQAPFWLLRLLALFDPELRQILPQIGKPLRVTNTRACAEMDMAFIPPDEALRASAAWLIANTKL
jgi:dihydroflavonol-4-reductase